MRGYIPGILRLVYCDERIGIYPRVHRLSHVYTDQPSWNLAFTGLVSLSLGKILDEKIFYLVFFYSPA